MAGPRRGSWPSASAIEAVSETFDSVLELARASWSPVFEPERWPADVKEISYFLDRFPDVGRAGRDHFRIG